MITWNSKSDAPIKDDGLGLVRGLLYALIPCILFWVLVIWEVMR